jgi:hypothetical protein
MHSMSFQKIDRNFDSVSPETLYSVSLINSSHPVEMDYSENPNLVVELEELRGVIGLSSATQAGILVNQDESCWLTNLGKNGSTEVYRPERKIRRKLAYNQVAYLKHGDYVGFYGAFFRVEITPATLYLVPLSEKKTPRS